MWRKEDSGRQTEEGELTRASWERLAGLQPLGFKGRRGSSKLPLCWDPGEQQREGRGVCLHPQSLWGLDIPSLQVPKATFLVNIISTFMDPLWLKSPNTVSLQTLPSCPSLVALLYAPFLSLKVWFTVKIWTPRGRQ